MDKKYTFEDVEALREKAGISYEEAVALLDKYDGDMTRALVELEKRGVLNEKKKHKRNPNAEGFGAWFKRILGITISTRVHITRGDMTIVNLTLLFLIAFVCFAPWLAIASVVMIFLLNLRVNLIKNSDVYASETLKSMVDGAAVTFKVNVENLTAKRDKKEETAEEKKEEIKRPEAAPDEEADGNDDYESVTIE